MLNYIWFGLILLAVLIGGFTGKMPAVTDGAIESAKKAVDISIGLVGIMTLWLGVMRLAERAGLVQIMARMMRPVLRWLFPEVPPDHPAMGSMLLNIAANMLGLSNAATPFGIRAMKDLEKLNPHPGTATNAMCTFLTINTSSIQLLPVTAVGVMAASGSKNPTFIIGTAFLATICSTVAGLTVVKFLEKLPMYRVKNAPMAPNVKTPSEKEETKIEAPIPAEESPAAPMPGWGTIVLLLFTACFAFFMFLTAYPELFGQTPTAEQLLQNKVVRVVDAISKLAVPFLLSFFPLYAILRRLKVYEEFVQGAKEGFNVAIGIIPYLVTILVAVGMFRSAGGIDAITEFLRPVLSLVKFPPELVPLSLMRPLSGSGSFALFTETVKEFGPDHIVSRMAGTLFGSTETTFYVITVYFGAIAVRRTRHAIASGLIADGVGIVASVIICRMMMG